MFLFSNFSAYCHIVSVYYNSVAAEFESGIVDAGFSTGTHFAYVGCVGWLVGWMVRVFFKMLHN